MRDHSGQGAEGEPSARKPQSRGETRRDWKLQRTGQRLATGLGCTRTSGGNTQALSIAVAVTQLGALVNIHRPVPPKGCVSL